MSPPVARLQYKRLLEVQHGQTTIFYVFSVCIQARFLRLWEHLFTACLRSRTSRSTAICEEALRAINKDLQLTGDFVVIVQGQCDKKHKPSSRNYGPTHFPRASKSLCPCDDSHRIAALYTRAPHSFSAISPRCPTAKI